MEVIRNYLESMFAKLPNTIEVQRAKQELYSMMEDKYTELLGEGKPENEAVAIVISEFGNLDELSETLGISGFMESSEDINRRHVSMQEAFDFIRDSEKHKFMLGIAVLLFIVSPIGPIIGDVGGGIANAIGILLFFVAIAAGVGIIIYSNVSMNRWDFLKNVPCSIDYATADAIWGEEQNDRSTHALRLTIGIILCILCFVPAGILDSVTASTFLNDVFGPVMLFAMIGIGVMLIIVSGAKQDACRTLLALNDRQTVSGSYAGMSENEPQFTDPTVNTIMSVYWPTITCLYLIWSFLSFDWYITWIIWPIAGIISGLIRKIYGVRR